MARIKDEEPRDVNDTDFTSKAKKYAFLKKQIEFLEEQQKDLRNEIFETLDEQGEPDAKGNLVIEFDEDVEGYAAIVKQRRVSRKINEEVAEKIISDRGLEDQLYKTIRVIDEDALMAALYSDQLTEAEIDEMYPQKITWALVLNKD